jgi:hypothetical protein
MARYLLLGLFLVISNSASAWQSNIAGGMGGSFYERTCPQNYFVVGLSGRTGAHVDHFEIKCAKWVIVPIAIGKKGGTGTGRQFHLDDVKQIGPRVGISNGGSAWSTLCGEVAGTPTVPRGAVSEIAFNMVESNDTYVINTMALVCRSGPGYRLLDKDSFGENDVHIPSQQIHRWTCPDRMFVTGVRGRSGVFVDSLGIICNRPDYRMH